MNNLKYITFSIIFFISANNGINNSPNNDDILTIDKQIDTSSITLIEDMNITSEIKLYNVLDWFKKQYKKVDKKIEINNNNNNNNIIVTTYTFISQKDKDVGSLQIVWDKDEFIYRSIILKMCVNGTPKTYYNKDAIKMMLTLLSYNSNFNYYF